MTSRHYKRSLRGASLVELAVGLFVLISIALPLVDLCALVLAASICDSTAKTAARVAASQTSNSASSVAQDVVSGVAMPPIMPQVQIAQFNYDTNDGTVTVQITATIHPPFKVWMMNSDSFTIQTSATEAIVAQ